MNKLHAALATAIISVTLSTGCGPNPTKSSLPPALHVAPGPSMIKSTTSRTWNPVGIESFLLQGRVVGIHTGRSENDLKLHIDHIILPGPLRTPSPKFPYPVGGTVTIPFDTPFARTGPMTPKIGEEIEVDVRQYTTGSHQKPFWGSDERHYYYQKDGQFYDENGHVTAVAT